MKKNLQIALAFWFVFTSIVLAQLIAVYLRNGVGGLNLFIQNWPLSNLAVTLTSTTLTLKPAQWMVRHYIFVRWRMPVLPLLRINCKSLRLTYWGCAGYLAHPPVIFWILRRNLDDRF